MEKRFSRPTGRVVVIILFLWVFLLDCSTLPPVQPVKDINSFIGKWHGKIWNTDLRWDFPVSLTAEEDGMFILNLPSFIHTDSDAGLTQIVGKWGVRDGNIWFKSEVFWLNGRGILHEGGGKRSVVFHSDDGRTTGWVMPSQ